MFILFLIATTAACSAASYAGVGRFRTWAESRRLLDVPNERSSHVLPTPRGGGAVIVAVVALALLLSISVGYVAVTPAAVPLVLGFAGIALVSAADDLRGLGTAVRLATHVACACLLVVAMRGAFAALAVTQEWVVLTAAVLWIVGLTNVYNFMDGIDGIAGGQAVIAGAAAAVLGTMADLPAVAVAGCAIAGASVGFLPHNWSPAHIFMGDVGSAFLGSAFATIVCRLYASDRATGFAAAASLWPFLFDSGFTLMRRTWRRENVFRAHRSHLYQRLVSSGWSHARVTAIYVAAAAVGAALGLAAARGASSIPLLLWLAVSPLTIWTLISRRERRLPCVRSTATGRRPA